MQFREATILSYFVSFEFATRKLNAALLTQFDTVYAAYQNDDVLLHCQTTSFKWIPNALFMKILSREPLH